MTHAPDCTTHQANSRPLVPLIGNTPGEYRHEGRLQTRMTENSSPIAVPLDASPQTPNK